MSTADLLVEQMFSWMDQREECANKLKKLAQELETRRENCSISQAVGSSVTVFGSVCLIGAGLATAFTGGAAAPLLGLAGGVCTGLGVGVSSITKLVEHLMESDTMKDAMKAERKVSRISKRIQRLFEKLKKKCKKDNPNDPDQHVKTEIVGAIAERNGLNPHFIKHTLQQHFSHGGPGAVGVYMDMISLQPGLEVELAGLLTFFSLKAGGEGSKILFVKGAEQLIKEVSKTGVKTVLRGGAKAVGGVIGLAFELPEAIDHWKDLIEKNNVTKASKSLRDTADFLQLLSCTLRAQLDKIKQMLEDLDQLKSCIENSNRSSEQKRNFIEIAEKCIRDPDLLKGLSEIDGTKMFLAHIFYLLKQELDKKRKNTERENIDIIFVAHGAITEPLIPARILLPLSTIEDVILYSPWNCTIDSNVAYGIATGYLHTQDRVFRCEKTCGCSNDDRHQPRSLPPNWNSMRDAGDSMIPNILVSPLKQPQGDAWKGVSSFMNEYGEPGKNRVVIPYIIPGYDGDGSMTIPFYMVTLALSQVLLSSPFKAKVHLAACLTRPSETTLTQDLEQQYSWTNDDICMTAREEALKQYPGLYRALRAMLDLQMILE